MTESNKDVSQTAMLIASLRALACHEEDPRIHGDDYMAELFLPDEKRIPLKETGNRRAIRKAIPDGLYEYIIARTKYFDDLFLRYLNLQIPQIVLLGAGYDSRAYRFDSLIGDTVIYEVDMPATQEMKRRILKSNDIRIHDNVRYVAADFGKNELFQELYMAGFQSSLQTLYIWEGVTFYLDPSSVRSMLISLNQHSASGSILGFDFQHKDSKADLVDTNLKDEKIRFGINAAQCARYLERYGFIVLERIDSEEMCNRYLMMSDGRKFGSVNPIMNMVTAQMN